MKLHVVVVIGRFRIGQSLNYVSFLDCVFIVFNEQIKMEVSAYHTTVATRC